MHFKRAAAVFPLICLIFLSGCLIDQAYENPFKGFSSYTPAGWGTYEDGMNAVFSSPDGLAQISVISVYDDNGTQLEKIDHAIQARAALSRAGSSVLVISNRTLNISGQPALESVFVFSYADANGTTYEQHMHSLVARKADHYWIVTMSIQPNAGKSAAEAYEKTFQRFVSEFRIL